MTTDPRRHSPAAERNAAPIRAALLALLPPRGFALEIASGSGQHAAAFGAALPGWQWQPTDADASTLPSIAAWCAELPNVLPPLQLDVLVSPWLGVPDRVGLVYCANMLHAAPWATCGALMQGAARHLDERGLLVTYGAYLVEGVPTTASNIAFDADLRARHADWGLRRLSDVQAQAAAAGLHLRDDLPMPANNRLLVWVRAAAG